MTSQKYFRHSVRFLKTKQTPTFTSVYLCRGIPGFDLPSLNFAKRLNLLSVPGSAPRKESNTPSVAGSEGSKSLFRGPTAVLLHIWIPGIRDPALHIFGTELTFGQS